MQQFLHTKNILSISDSSISQFFCIKKPKYYQSTTLILCIKKAYFNSKSYKKNLKRPSYNNNYGGYDDFMD